MLDFPRILVRFLAKHHTATLVFWLVLTIVCLFCLPIYVLNMKLVFYPPSSEPSYDAHVQMEKYFPLVEDYATTVVFVEVPEGEDIDLTTYDPLRAFFDELEARLVDKYGAYVLSFDSIFSLADEGLELSAQGYVTGDHRATYATLTVDKPDTSVNSMLFILYLRSVVADLEENVSELSVFLLGSDVIVVEILLSTGMDVAVMVVLALPFAFLVIGLFQRSVRILLFPLIVVVVALIVSLGASFPMALTMSVSPFVLGIQAAIALAMSIDYTLFLTVQFRQALTRGESVVTACYSVVKNAGKVILVSGCCLLVTFCSLLFFGIDLLSTIGLGSVIALIVIIVLSPTLEVAMILHWPRFFSRLQMNGHRGALFATESDVACFGLAPDAAAAPLLPHDAARDTHTTMASSRISASHLEPRAHALDDGSSAATDAARDDSEHAADTLAPSAGAAPRQRRYISRKSKYKNSFGRGNRPGIDRLPTPKELVEIQRRDFSFRTVRRFTDLATSIGIVVVGVALLVGFAIALSGASVNYDNSLTVPSGTEAGEAIYKFGEAFSEGYVYPYIILLSPADAAAGATAFSEDAFQLANDLIAAILAEVDDDSILVPELITAPSYLAGIEVPYALAVEFTDATSDTYDTVAARNYRYSFDMFMSADGAASQIFTAPNIPWSGEGMDTFILQVRGILTSDQFAGAAARAGLRLDLFAECADVYDSSSAIYSNFPLLIGVTCAILFLLTGFAFRSVFVPLRLLVSLSITVVFVFGLCALIFDSAYGGEGFYWAVPPLTFCIVLGLGTDYDSFLFSTIRNFRVRGLFHKDAIHRAVYESGSTINAAGIIMALSFAGMALSSVPMMAQFGLILVIAVLFDTFIIRTFFVPAMTALGGWFTWWPFHNRLPREQFDAFALFNDSQKRSDLKEAESSAHIRQNHVDLSSSY
eukprot:gnl/Chilomastix_cuspidata/1040.p1 GENE.gnl/Chilomastix_cuspidata/1040~~gnl/Chilomastix_cuspidata/1040.p1  ORF type:complete len:933 (+),score=479.25 gnl/Chilomastix_cuspidata/1040:1972-4770(+)